MGKIRTFQGETISPQAGFVESKSAAPGLAMAEITNNASAQITAGLNAFQKQQESAEQSDISASLAEFQSRKTIEWSEAVRTANPNDSEMGGRFLEQMNSELEEMGGNVKHRANQSYFDDNKSSLKGKFTTIAYLDTQEMLNTAQEANQGRQEDAFSNMLVTDPTQLQNVRDQFTYNVESNEVFSTETKTRLIRAGEKRFANASLDGWITPAENNPDITVEQIDDLRDRLLDPQYEYGKLADPATYQEAFKRLDRLKVTTSNVNQVAIVSEIDDIVTAYSRFGGAFPQEEFDVRVAQLDPEKDASVLNRINRSVEEAHASVNLDEGIVGQSLGDTQLELANEVANFQSGETPVENLNENLAGHDARVLRLQDHIEQFDADGSRWASTNDSSVRARLLEFSQNPTSRTFDAFASASMEKQRAFSPYTDPRILTGGMADMIGQMIGHAERGTPGAITAAREGLQAQRDLAGSHWPQVSYELLEAEAITPAHYVVANLPPRAEQLSDTLLQLSGFSETELSKMIPDSPSALADARNDAIRALKPFQDTLVNTPGGVKIAAAYQEALTKLILSKDVRDIDIVKKNSWFGSDANALAERMVLDDYNFVGSMRIPKALNVADVTAATSVAQRALTADLIYAPGRLTADQGQAEVFDFSAPPAGSTELYSVSPFDTNKFPPVTNENGSVSHIITKSWNFNGEEVLVPTMADGKKLTDDEAQQRFLATGEHFGKFDSPEAADAFAKTLEATMQKVDLDGSATAMEQDLRASSARAFGAWATNGDETGVLLLDEVGHPIQVKDERGVARPYEFTWEELEQLNISDFDSRLAEQRERRRNRLGLGPRSQ